MDVRDIFTPESIEEFRRRTAEAAGPGQRLLDQYRQDHEDQLREAPDLRAWIDALEDGDLDLLPFPVGQRLPAPGCGICLVLIHLPKSVGMLLAFTPDEVDASAAVWAFDPGHGEPALW